MHSGLGGTGLDVVNVRRHTIGIGPVDVGRAFVDWFDALHRCHIRNIRIWISHGFRWMQTGDGSSGHTGHQLLGPDRIWQFGELDHCGEICGGRNWRWNLLHHSFVYCRDCWWSVRHWWNESWRFCIPIIFPFFFLVHNYSKQYSWHSWRNRTIVQKHWNADVIHYQFIPHLRTTSVRLRNHSDCVHDQFHSAAEHTNLSSEKREIRSKHKMRKMADVVRAVSTGKWNNFFSKFENSQKAEKALKYYKACDGSSVAESTALYHEMERIKALSNQRQANKKLQLQDFCKWKTGKKRFNSVRWLINCHSSIIRWTSCRKSPRSCRRLELHESIFGHFHILDVFGQNTGTKRQLCQPIHIVDHFRHNSNYRIAADNPISR